jgi:hypothetical protein
MKLTDKILKEATWWDKTFNTKKYQDEQLAAKKTKEKAWAERSAAVDREREQQRAEIAKMSEISANKNSAIVRFQDLSARVGYQKAYQFYKENPRYFHPLEGFEFDPKFLKDMSDMYQNPDEDYIRKYNANLKQRETIKNRPASKKDNTDTSSKEKEKDEEDYSAKRKIDNDTFNNLMNTLNDLNSGFGSGGFGGFGGGSSGGAGASGSW